MTRRREDVATLLSGYGPRVQFSMSGCELRSRREATALGAKLRALIDAIADQVRIYPLDERTARGVVVLGAILGMIPARRRGEAALVEAVVRPGVPGALVAEAVP